MNTFRAGQRYQLSSRTVLVERTTRRPNVEGGTDEILLNGQELVFGITGEDGVEHQFIDGRHLQPGADILANNLKVDARFTLQQLVEHFEIPDVPDVARAHPERYEQNQTLIADIQRFLKEQI